MRESFGAGGEPPKYFYGIIFELCELVCVCVLESANVQLLALFELECASLFGAIHIQPQ